MNMVKGLIIGCLLALSIAGESAQDYETNPQQQPQPARYLMAYGF